MLQQAIALTEPGCLTAIPDTLPPPSSGGARIRIRTIGVCGTDIHAFHGRQPFFEYPRILGHELAAEIVEINGDSDLRPGQLVAVEPYLNDPASPASRKDKTNCCESLQVLGVHCDGGMRPEINVPVGKLLPAATATPDQLALVEMLGIGRHAVGRSGANKRHTALILGAGPIGLSVLTFLQGQAGKVAVADLNDRRLGFCREAFGAAETIHIEKDTDLVSEVRDRFGGELPDVVFDATGSSTSMHGTFDLIAHGGAIVFVGLFQGDVTFHDPNFHRREVSLLASRNATHGELQEVIAAVESGAIDTSSWITHRLAFDYVPSCFADTIADPELTKAVIEVG